MQELELCNRALALIKQPALDTLTDGSEAAKRWKLLYPGTRDQILREGWWNFATRIEVLVVSAETVPGWTYVYKEPSKLITIRKVFWDINSQDPDELDFRSLSNAAGDGQLIVTQTPGAYIEYTRQITDTEVFDPSFVHALEISMAANMAPAIGGSIETALDLMKVAANVISSSQRLNASQKRITKTRSSSYQDVR